MVQLSLQAGTRLKEMGIARVAANGADWLGMARDVARQLAQRGAIVTSDDVLEVAGLPMGVHHNVIGAIFTERGWIRVGFTHTKRIGSHARIISKWCLAEAA